MWSFNNNKIYYFQSRHSVIIWKLSLAFFRLTYFAFNFIKVIFVKIQLAFELFLQNRDFYEVSNYRKMLYLRDNNWTLIVLKKNAVQKREKKQKKSNKSVAWKFRAFDFRMSQASGCTKHQDVPGVRIPGVSCLVSGLSRTSRSRLPQIFTGTWFYFFANDKFWNKKDCVFWCKNALLSALFAFSRKSNVVCWWDIIIPRQRDLASQWSNIFDNYQHWLCKHSDSPGCVSTLCSKKPTWLNSCFNKIKFLCAIVIWM